MKRVLIVSSPHEIGGVERLVCNLTRELNLRGWKAELVFPGKAHSTGVLEWCHQQGVDAQGNRAVFPHNGGAYRWRDMMKLRNLIRSSNAGIVNMHYGDNFLSYKDALAIRLAGCRHLIASVHNTTRWIDGNGESQHKRQMTVSAARLCDFVVANSSATAQVLLDAGVPASKVKRIPCGVVPPRYPGADCMEIRQKLEIPADTFVVGSMSRLVKQKGIQFLLQAFSRLNGNAVLLVAGDGPYRSELESLAARILPSSRYRFLGTVDRTDDFYSVCDVLALPSLQEGFGMVFVEAAFHGIPSIGSDIDGVPDVIKNGKTGILIPPGSVDGLQEALELLWRDPSLRLRLGEAARGRAEALFTNAIMTTEYERLYNR